MLLSMVEYGMGVSILLRAGGPNHQGISLCLIVPAQAGAHQEFSQRQCISSTAMDTSLLLDNGSCRSAPTTTWAIMDRNVGSRKPSLRPPTTLPAQGRLVSGGQGHILIKLVA